MALLWTSLGEPQGALHQGILLQGTFGDALALSFPFLFREEEAVAQMDQTRVLRVLR